MITGKTRVVAVIGDPIGHSLSPKIHNAAFDALGLDWIFVACRVASGSGREAVGAVRALGLAGMSVTMPHKRAAAEACDTLSESASLLESVNTVVNVGGVLEGLSTDGAGFLGALTDANVKVANRTTLILGAGGAARAVTLALDGAGGKAQIWARRFDAASACALLGVSATAIDPSGLDDAVKSADLIVNATPLGMNGEMPPFDPALLRVDQVVVDLIYEPRETPLIVAARARGITCLNGVGMLVHQAAIAFEHWTGNDAPIDVMRAAAEVR